MSNGEYAFSDAPASTPEAQKWADVFKQALKQTVTASDNPASETLKELRQLTSVSSWPSAAYYNPCNSFTYRVLNTIQEPHRSYLIESNILLAEGMVKEAAHRETPDDELALETYMETRRHTIGIRPIFDIGRWIYDLDIAHDVLTHPEILKLEQHIYHLVFLANVSALAHLHYGLQVPCYSTQDLYSYKKEFFACGAHHNYVTITLSDPITGLDKYDRQGAINHTSQRFLEVLADLEHQRKTLPTFGESEDAKISMYVDMMMDVVAGNIQWSLTTARYGHFEIAGTAEAPIWGDVVFDMDPL